MAGDPPTIIRRPGTEIVEPEHDHDHEHSHSAGGTT
jgi:hypothetical protein